MINPPTLRQLQYLTALHKTHNFRKAAEICHVTQPTLSAAIKEMESLLGLPVIDRSRPKNIIFTPFGEEVIAMAQKIMPQIENLMERARNMAEPLSGPIRLGLIPTIAPYLIPDILPYLQKSFPKIEWQIIEGMSGVLVEKLNQGALDIALLAFPFDTPNLSQKTFFEEKFFCAAKKGTFPVKQILTLKDLDSHKLLLLEDGHCLRDHALSACKLQTKRDEKALSATSLLTLIQMVGHGYGITLLPEMVVRHGALPKDITLHAFKNPQPSRKIGVAWRAQDPQIETISQIINALGKKLNKQ